MSSAIMDFFFDKIISFSAKMKKDSSKFSGPSYLMSVNSNSVSHQLSPVDLCDGVMGDAIVKGESANQIVPLKQTLGYLTGNYSFSFRNAENIFLHPLNNLVTDICRHSHISTESRLLSNDSLISHVVNSFCNQFVEMNRNYKSGVKINKSLNPPVTETIKSATETHHLVRHLVNSFCNQFDEMNRNRKSGVKINKPLTPPVTETMKSATETISPVKKKCELTNKNTIANTLTLNKELANRKTKKMHRRSKKRRRRQKKSQRFDSNSSASVSDDDVDRSVTSSLTRVCVVSDKAEFGCTVAISQSIKVAPNTLSSFVVSVSSASDDDSEWEFYEDEPVNSSCQETDTDIVSNLTISKSSILECSQPVNSSNQFLSSFMVPVEASTDDESDWDCCDSDIFPETPDFGFTGLFVTSLCTSQTHLVDPSCSINNTSEDDETVKSRIHLKEVNKVWNESANKLEGKPKLPTKVSFAPDEILAEVFPVEIYERKGEWEIYATERLRFKRKIDELEKILSPCFYPDHRAKVFKKISEAVL